VAAWPPANVDPGSSSSGSSGEVVLAGQPVPATVTTDNVQPALSPNEDHRHGPVNLRCTDV
jgi:hypothetical protein